MARLVTREVLKGSGGTAGAVHTYDNGHVWHIVRTPNVVVAVPTAKSLLTPARWHRMNAEEAQLWRANGAMATHSTYPHQPGTLYDCPACESRCYCDRDATVEDWNCCVHCARVAESETYEREAEMACERVWGVFDDDQPPF